MSYLRNDNYVDAYIELRVPKWQIGQEATIYFKDTMCTRGICKELQTMVYPQVDGITLTIYTDNATYKSSVDYVTHTK